MEFNCSNYSDARLSPCSYYSISNALHSIICIGFVGVTLQQNVSQTSPGHEAVSSVRMRSQMKTVLIITQTLVPTGVYSTNFNIFVIQKNSTGLVKGGCSSPISLPNRTLRSHYVLVHNIPFYSAS